jgi:predicted DCC family thiol-disulfide oxidoreductase YuxK
MAHPILLYDGVCGLCNGLVQFLLKRDKHNRLRFAALQSDFAEKVLRRHGVDASDLDTVYVINDYDQPAERLFSRSDAILEVVKRLGGPWAFAGVGKILPRFIRDAIYRQVAKNRYRVFGKFDTCMLPEPHQRKKFLDM